MAQNPWLEMFDKRMSEVHQLEYLKQQMAEAQASRLQRGTEFQQNTRDNALARGLEQQRIDMAKAAQEQQLQAAKANLLFKDAVRAHPEDTPDITLGGEGFNLPDPLFAATREAQFKQDWQDQEISNLNEMFDKFQVPGLMRAPIIAEVITGRNVSGSFNAPEMLAAQLQILNDPGSTPEAKRSAGAYVSMMTKRTGTGASNRPTSWQHTAKVKQTEAELRMRLAYVVGNQTADPDYSSKALSAIPALAQELIALGKDPELVKEAIARVMAEFQRRQAAPNSGAAAMMGPYMNMLMGGGQPAPQAVAPVQSTTPMYPDR